MPHASLCPEFRSWLAPFVRILAWSHAFHVKWATDDVRQRWHLHLDRLATLVTDDGFCNSPVSADQPVPPSAVDLFKQIIQISGLPPESTAREFARSLKRKPRSDLATRSRSNQLAGPSAQSDWAALAILRTSPSVRSDSLVLTWEQQRHQLTLAARGYRVLAGPWDSRVSIDGTPVTNDTAWVCSCWFHDAEVSFAELEREIASGVRQVRHVLLSQNEHFAVLTDTVSATPEAQIELQTTVSLKSGFRTETNGVTRDVLLKDDKSAVRLIPAWLDDDRVIRPIGDLRHEPDQLQLQTTGIGGAALPLVLDWHPRRTSAPADWNQLTVSEERQKVGADSAAGYRVRNGDLQLLIYRSLRPGKTLRAVLGHHTPAESVYARFRPTGGIAPLVTIENST
ncbi:MAG: hypothetical protein R3C49_24800 [Planctomycetaceae bacterium]